MRNVTTRSDDDAEFEELIRNPPFRFAWAIEQIEKRFKDKKLAILDVGAGRGILVKLLQNKGHKVEAVEINERVRAEFKKKSTRGSHLWNSIDSIKHDKKFDVITCLEVLEHQREAPIILIRKMKKRLKKGGILVLTTPIEKNMDDPDHRWYFDFYDVQIFCRAISETYDIFLLNKHQPRGTQTHLFGCIARKL